MRGRKRRSVLPRHARPLERKVSLRAFFGDAIEKALAKH